MLSRVSTEHELRARLAYWQVLTSFSRHIAETDTKRRTAEYQGTLGHILLCILQTELRHLSQQTEHEIQQRAAELPTPAHHYLEQQPKRWQVFLKKSQRLSSLIVPQDISLESTPIDTAGLFIAETVTLNTALR